MDNGADLHFDTPKLEKLNLILKSAEEILKMYANRGILYLYTNLRRFPMAISYNKLWKLLIDRGLKKTELVKLSGITSNAMAKMGRNESVQVDTLGKVCAALGCNVDDIMEFVPDETKGDK